MPKNKKKKAASKLSSIKSVTPVGSTATSKKQNPKAERIANIAKGVAIAAIPVGRAASVAGKIVSKVVTPKMSSTGKVTKSRTFTQGPKAKIEAKAPGGISYSPVTKTKIKVKYDTQGLSVSQQQNVKALTTSQKARRGLSTAKGVAAGVVGSKEPKNKKKASKKKSK